MNGYIPSAQEVEYLKNYDPGAWPRPSVTADLMVLAGKKEKKLLLVKRGGFPYKGWWALPGGFCEPGEPPEKTAERELGEETGVKVEKYSLLGVFGGEGRDPRGWTVTCAFLALTEDEPEANAADDAEAAVWFSPSVKNVGKDGLGRSLWELKLSSEKEELSAVIAQNEKFPELIETGLEITDRRGIAFDHAKFIAAALLRQVTAGKESL